MLSGRLRAAVAGLAIAVLAGVTPAAAQAAFVKGSPSGGDPYFPKAGNGGYDVSRYNLNLRYQPSVNRLVGKATIRARAKKSLSRFDLDFRHLDIKGLSVDGKRARYARRGQELKITPRHGLRKGSRFDVRVHYHGHPRPVEFHEAINKVYKDLGDQFGLTYFFAMNRPAASSKPAKTRRPSRPSGTCTWIP